MQTERECVILDYWRDNICTVLFALNVDTVQSFKELFSYNSYAFVSLIIGASVLFTGGAGLLLAFIIEYKIGKKKD